MPHADGPVTAPFKRYVLARKPGFMQGLQAQRRYQLKLQAREAEQLACARLRTHLRSQE